MNDVSSVAILVAAIAVLVVSSVYYAVLGRQLAALSDAYLDTSRPPAWKLALEVARNVVLASVVAGLASRLEITDRAGALELGIALWIGFPVVLLSGSVIHESVPWKLASIHAGDWFAKLLVVAVIAGVWR
jgi:hypothetical protein